LKVVAVVVISPPLTAKSAVRVVLPVTASVLERVVVPEAARVPVMPIEPERNPPEPSLRTTALAVFVLTASVVSTLKVFKFKKLLSISEFDNGRPLTVAPLPAVLLVVIEAILLVFLWVYNIFII
jgi:hypothetical protein